jgi:hypothetical protein
MENKWTQEERQMVAMEFLALCEVWNKQISDHLTSIYMRALQSLPALDAAKSINKAIFSCKWFPKPAELLAFANGSLEEQAIKAWNILCETVSKVGKYDSVFFEDTRISQMIDFFGGWITICNWTKRDLEFKRDDFIKGYVAIHQPQAPSKHPGILEIENGHDQRYKSLLEPPVFVALDGNSQQILLPGHSRPMLPDIEESNEDDGDLVPVSELMKSLAEMVGRKSSEERK